MKNQKEIEDLAEKITTGSGVGRFTDKPSRVANFILGYEQGINALGNRTMAELKDEAIEFLRSNNMSYNDEEIHKIALFSQYILGGIII